MKTVRLRSRTASLNLVIEEFWQLELDTHHHTRKKHQGSRTGVQGGGRLKMKLLHRSGLLRVSRHAPSCLFAATIHRDTRSKLRAPGTLQSNATLQDSHNGLLPSAKLSENSMLNFAIWSSTDDSRKSMNTFPCADCCPFYMSICSVGLLMPLGAKPNKTKLFRKFLSRILKLSFSKVIQDWLSLVWPNEA